MCSKLRSAVLFGEDAAAIEEAFDGLASTSRVTGLHEAVNCAAEIAEAGDTVLLAPACASFDQYPNYQARGDDFRSAVMELTGMSVSSITMPFPARLRTPMQIDPVLLAIAVALLFGGLVILASASISISDNTENDPFYYVGRQAIAALLGGAAAVLPVLFIPMRFWSNVGPLMLLVGLALLLVVLIPGVGHTVNGSTRWLRFGALNLQVSEPVRLCLMIYLAGYLVRKNKLLREQFTGFLRPMAVLSVAGVLLLAEPDFGAAIVLLTTALAMLFVAGARFRDFSFFSALHPSSWWHLQLRHPTDWND